MHDVTEKNVKYFKCRLLPYRNIKYKTFYQSYVLIECSFTRASVYLISHS